MTNDDDDFAPYRLPDRDNHPEVFAARCVRMPEHQHLVDNEIEIDWIIRCTRKVRGGREVLGTVYEPKVQGDLKDLFQWMLKNLLGRLPAFLVVLDEAYWNEASDREREILVFHELSHIRQKLDVFGAPKFDKDGRPVYGLHGHDVEEFTQVVARYGTWNDDVAAFVRAANAAG